MLTTLTLCLLAYLVGSVPSGYLLLRAVRGVDLRQFGSNNVGAINACSVGGPLLGLATLGADAGKAVVAVWLVHHFTGAPWAVAAAALCVLAGHAYSAWLYLKERRFSEGKSVASSLGVLVAVALTGGWPWLAAIVPPVVWLAGLFVPRLVTGRWHPISPATMAATLSVPVVVLPSHTHVAYAALSTGMALLVLARHRGNIRRLLAGTEPPADERLTRPRMRRSQSRYHHTPAPTAGVPEVRPA